MRLNMKWIAVVLVVVIIVLAYFALVGVQAKTDDVNDPKDDPTGGDRLPTAYGVMHTTVVVDNAVGRYTGDAKNSYCGVYDYISFSEGAVYQNNKFDVLGFWSDDMSTWVEVKITGPGQFLFEWQSEHTEYSLSEWGHKTIDFTSGRMYFWDQGGYTMSVTAFADGDSGKFQLDTEIVVFEVSV